MVIVLKDLTQDVASVPVLGLRGQFIGNWKLEDEAMFVIYVFF